MGASVVTSMDAYESIVDCLVWSVVARSITPAQSIPDDEDDPADYPPVINPDLDGKNGSIRRICALESRNKSCMAAPPHAASESIDHLIRKIFNGS